MDLRKQLLRAIHLAIGAHGGKRIDTGSRILVIVLVMNAGNT